MRRSLTQPQPAGIIGADGWLSVDDVARAISRHPEVVRRQARAGRLPGEKIGRGWFFRPQRLIGAGYRQFVELSRSDRREAAPAEGVAARLVATLNQLRDPLRFPADVSTLADSLLALLERGRQRSEPWYLALEQAAEGSSWAIGRAAEESLPSAAAPGRRRRHRG